jgi:hypothetical protein
MELHKFIDEVGFYYKSTEVEQEIEALKDSLREYMEMYERSLHGKPVREYEHKLLNAQTLLMKDINEE